MIFTRATVPLQTAVYNNVCSSCARKILWQTSVISRRSINSRRTIAIARNVTLDGTYFQAYAPSNGTIAFSTKHQIKAETRPAPSVVTPADAGQSQTAQHLQHRPRRRRAQQDEDKPLPLDASATLSQAASSSPPSSFRRIFATYLSLSKPRLAFLIVLTTTAAYSIYPVPDLLSASATTAPSLSTLTLAFLTTGTFLTVASANALNMLFEPQHDAKMSRTRNRPLVRGLLSKRAALFFAIGTGVVGTGMLWIGVNPTTALLGASNLVLYAFIYTPFKRIHPVNTWVGAVVGAIPPLMGWCAAASQYSTQTAPVTDLASLLAEGKDLLFTEQAIGGWLLAGLLFAWQFPHFFALSYAVRKEYAEAGYRMLTSTNIPMAARVSLRYSVLMFPICVSLTAYNVTDPVFIAASTAINAWMLKEAWRFWRLNGEQGSARKLFWASVWQLPIVLVMAMILKKGLWDRIRRAVLGEPELEEPHEA